jgi:hypothetical protein
MGICNVIGKWLDAADGSVYPGKNLMVVQQSYRRLQVRRIQGRFSFNEQGACSFVLVHIWILL